MTKFILSLTIVFSILSSMANLHAESTPPEGEKKSSIKSYVQDLAKKKGMVAVLTASTLAVLVGGTILIKNTIQSSQRKKLLKDKNLEPKDHNHEAYTVHEYTHKTEEKAFPILMRQSTWSLEQPTIQ